MQFEFNFNPFKRASVGDSFTVGGREVAVEFVRNEKARRYMLRVRPDGSVRVTVPRRGSLKEAREFAGRNVAWIEKQLERVAARAARKEQEWKLGSEILLRGELLRIEPCGDNFVRVGTEVIPAASDLRSAISAHFRRLAAREMEPRVVELASLHGLVVRRVTIRNQRSRWGSCSRRATISLNWRLIQAPAHVRDYLILHELMHLREMNHSARFWRQVEAVCPEYQAAEKWLREHAELLR